ncbi:hypothetical protein D9613_003571 [Agrocybe pediades]|uniref:Uncharacterized protein n=1 Tax=Agrocybe pediades TaxID=84607 RepID=A0A8H4VL56_9AGAR|nr:hypothetical protein D9613_003571 [Agrocybe pediades]
MTQTTSLATPKRAAFSAIEADDEDDRKGPSESEGDSDPDTVVVQKSEIKDMALLYTKAMKNVATKDRLVARLQVALQDSKDEFKRQAEEWSKERKEMELKVNQALSRQAALENENAGLRSFLTNMQAHATETINAAIMENQRINEHTQSITRSYQDLVGENEALNTSLSHCRTEIERLKLSERELISRNDRLTMEFNNSVSEAAQLKETFEEVYNSAGVINARHNEEELRSRLTTVAESISEAVQCNVCFEPITSPAV